MNERMRTNITAPLCLAITGGLLVAIPRWLFPTCGYSPLVDRMLRGMMHCDTTGTVTIFLGMGTLVFVPPLFLLSRGRARQLVLLAVMITAIALFPLFLVWPGVCKATTMPCRVGTLPAVLLVAGIQLLVAGIAMVAESRSGRV